MVYMLVSFRAGDFLLFCIGHSVGWEVQCKKHCLASPVDVSGSSRVLLAIHFHPPGQIRLVALTNDFSFPVAHFSTSLAYIRLDVSFIPVKCNHILQICCIHIHLKNFGLSL